VQQPGTVPPASSPAPADGTAKPAPAQQFPFPGETAAPPANPPAAPAAPSSAASKFPFPGESADSSSSSSSSSCSSSSSSNDDSSSSSNDSPDRPALKDAGSSGSTRFERHKLAVPEDNNKRELDDLDVSHFYITTGDYLGAYMRAQDAVKLYPDDENAHIALAIAADKLKKNDEATAEYKKYLAMAPDGEKAKQAHKALETLSGK
jgi:tetratricopeptide (TPR) repeat protein